MCKIDDPDRFQKISAGIQSLLVSIALLIGGGWTLYVFNSQLQVENARAQLNKLKRELEESPRLELDISVHPMSPNKRAGSRYFDCRLLAKNVGTKSTILRFADKAIRLHRVEIGADGQPVWALINAIDIPMGDSKEDRLHAITLHVNTSKYASWVVAISKPGIYVLEFSSSRSPSEIEEARALGSTARDVIWGAERYFVVE
ncbi:MAG: hypothetical protein WA056_08415 [Gallionella sp.]